MTISIKAGNRIPRVRVEVRIWMFLSFAPALTATTSYLRYDKLLIGQRNNHGTKNIQRSIVCMAQTLTANTPTGTVARLQERHGSSLLQQFYSRAPRRMLPSAFRPPLTVSTAVFTTFQFRNRHFAWYQCPASPNSSASLEGSHVKTITLPMAVAMLRLPQPRPSSVSVAYSNSSRK